MGSGRCCCSVMITVVGRATQDLDLAPHPIVFMCTPTQSRCAHHMAHLCFEPPGNLPPKPLPIQKYTPPPQTHLAWNRNATKATRREESQLHGFSTPSRLSAFPSSPFVVMIMNDMMTDDGRNSPRDKVGKGALDRQKTHIWSIFALGAISVHMRSIRCLMIAS